MFVQELDRPAYLIVPSRGFDDRQLGITGDVLDYALSLQVQANLLQLWLREVYSRGDSSYRVEAPPWLLEGAANAAMQKQRDSEAASSKTLRLKQQPKASATSTSPSSSVTKEPPGGTNQTSN